MPTRELDVVALGERLRDLEARQGNDERLARRRIFWQMAGGVMALVTTAVVIWQTFLIRAQLSLQTTESYEARRAELIARLYDRQESCRPEDRVCSSEPFGVSCSAAELECPLKAAGRTREEALRSLLALDRGRGRERINLTGLNADGLILSGLDLSQANLTAASFAGAWLFKTRLDHAELSLTNFTAALLCMDAAGAESGVSMVGATGTKAVFRNAHACDSTFATSALVEATCPDGTLGAPVCRGPQLVPAADPLQRYRDAQPGGREAPAGHEPLAPAPPLSPSAPVPVPVPAPE